MDKRAVAAMLAPTAEDKNFGVGQGRGDKCLMSARVSIDERISPADSAESSKIRVGADHGRAMLDCKCRQRCIREQSGNDLLAGYQLAQNPGGDVGSGRNPCRFGMQPCAYATPGLARS